MICIPFIYFTALFAYFYSEQRRWGIDLAATSLLIIISLCAILIDINDEYGDYGINEYAVTLPSIFLFCLQWTIVLLPLHYLSGLDFRQHHPVKEKMLYALAVVVAISSILILASSINDIREALIMDMVDVRGAHYKELAQGTEASGNYLMVIPTILTNNPFPTLALFLWFYMKAFMNTSILVRAGILMASILQAITAITMSGRAAMIYWAFDFFLIYSFFYRYISFRTKLTINLICSVIGSLAAILFISITIARFDSGSFNPLASLYGYAGQHINNFCIMIEEGGDTPLLTDRIFPLLTKHFGGVEFDMVEHYEKLASYTPATVNVFDTFGGEVFLDLGWLGYIVCLLLLYLFYIYLQSDFKELQFHHIFLLTVCVAFFTRGLFAWPFTGYYTTYALFLMFVSFFMFKYEYKI